MKLSAHAFEMDSDNIKSFAFTLAESNAIKHDFFFFFFFFLNGSTVQCGPSSLMDFSQLSLFLTIDLTVPRPHLGFPNCNKTRHVTKTKMA
jgi:hypothetical protein